VRRHSDGNQVSRTVRVNADQSLFFALLQQLQLLVVLAVKALNRATMQLIVTPSSLQVLQSSTEL